MRVGAVGVLERHRPRKNVSGRRAGRVGKLGEAVTHRRRREYRIMVRHGRFPLRDHGLPIPGAAAPSTTTSARLVRTDATPPFRMYAEPPNTHTTIASAQR